MIKGRAFKLRRPPPDTQAIEVLRRDAFSFEALVLVLVGPLDLLR